MFTLDLLKLHDAKTCQDKNPGLCSIIFVCARKLASILENVISKDQWDGNVIKIYDEVSKTIYIKL